MAERIVIVGTSCSGKTTLAASISERLGIRHIELDALHWKPGWVEREDEEFRELVREAVAEDSWVADGNYSVVRDITWPRSTTIIWLNYHSPLVLYRAVSRTLHRVFTRKKLHADNVETFRMAFLSSESIIWWVITTHHRKKERYTRLLGRQGHQGQTIRIFKSPGETRRYLDSLT